MPETHEDIPACRVEVRALSPDPAAPSAGALIASAEPSGDGRWYMRHRDGRHVIVTTTVEIIERMIGIARDTSLAERWRRTAAQLPADSERARTLRFCADQLIALMQPICLACGAATGADDDHACRPAAESDTDVQPLRPPASVPEPVS
jgi:hypothetical protein